MADVPSAELLLQDIAWLRRLATMLAVDRDEADDLVQEAWIAAWRRKPDATRPMRAWLTKVVRDLAGMKRRSERRRVARHAVVDEPQGPAAPDEALAQMRLHRLLVDLVIELEEPYRSTIIGRFVEGRTSASIAASLGIPAGTVRKRLHEGLARLRAGLDANAGERKGWAPAVLAFAKGGMLVAKPTKLVLVVLAAVLLLASVATVIVRTVRGSSRDPTPATATATTTTMLTSTRASESAVSSRVSPAASNATDARTPSGSEHRAAMLAAIATARHARDHGSGVPAKPRGPTMMRSDSTATTLDIVDRSGDISEWSKRALGTLNRLLGQCYDLGRAEDGTLTGVITIRFTLVGEPDIGGLLERVEIVDADTTLTQHTIRDCFTQQLYALELDPPPAGVTVERELHLEVP